MRIKFIVSSFSIFLFVAQVSHAQSEEKIIHALVQQFLDAVSRKDSIAYQNLFLKDGYKYTLSQRKDSIITRGSSAFTKPTFQPGVKYKEALRPKGVKIQVHKNMAMAWVPYDFWVNDKFSHCGVDVFTYMKTEEGWKIAVIAYSVEREGCNDW